MLQIFVDGKSRHLETKPIKNTVSPIVRLLPLSYPSARMLRPLLTLILCLQWNQEFVFGAESRSTIQIRVLHWNRFSSDKSIGNINIDLSDYALDTFHDDRLPLDTQGELRVIIQLCRINIPKPLSLNLNLANTRIHFERSTVYPGQAVRGCFMVTLQKAQKIRSIRLTLEGVTRTFWVQNVGRGYIKYEAAAVLFNSTAALAGPLEDKKESFLSGPSATLYPFEYVLPLSLPPTYSSPPEPAQYQPFNYVDYRAVGFVDLASKPNLVRTLSFRVLANPSFIPRGLCSNPMAPIAKDSDVQMEISGSTTAWIGDEYQISVKVQNRGAKPISTLRVRLIYAIWYSARHSGTWTRAGGVWTPVEHWDFSDLPGLPIQPGQDWEGKIQVTIPINISTSQHSRLSPLIQNAYQIEVIVPSKENVFSPKTRGSRYKIFMADHNRAFELLSAPLEPEGTIGKIGSAPETPDLSSVMVPEPVTDPSLLIMTGRPLGEVSRYPGAFYPPQTFIPKIANCPIGDSHYPQPGEWEIGKVPTWLSIWEEGVSLSDEALASFERIEESPAVASSSGAA